MRFESKFLVNPPQYESLNQIIQILATQDPHSKNGYYPVFSMYYDDFEKNATYDKINGEYFHTRIRLRKYSTSLKDQDTPFYLELKFKSDTRSEKTRLKLTPDFKWTDPQNWKKINTPEIDLFLNYTHRHPLIKSVNVFYERSAFHLPENIRLNFDQTLLYLDPEDTQITPDHIHTNTQLPPDQRILEIKSPTPNLPNYLKDLLNHHQIPPNRFSKFAGAIQHLTESQKESTIVV